MATPGPGCGAVQVAPSVSRRDNNYLEKKENFTHRWYPPGCGLQIAWQGNVTGGKLAPLGHTSFFPVPGRCNPGGEMS